MKRFIIVLLFFLTSSVHAAEVTLRFSSQDAAARIVLESDEQFIADATTVYTLSSVRIGFPARFELKKQQGFMFETISKDRFLMITLKEAIDIRVYKLTAPGRIVIDLKTKQKPESGPVKTTEPKAENKPVNQHSPEATAESGPALQKHQPLKAVVIDVGHGGYDYGIVAGNTKEKDINLLIAKELGAALAKKEKKPILTRKVDQAISLEDRIGFTAKNKPDAFISIHASAGSGFSIYISAAENQETDVLSGLYNLASRQARHLEKSMRLADKISEELRRGLKTEVLLREMPLPVLAAADAPALLIEYPSPGVFTYDKAAIERVVDAVVKGIASYEQ